MSDAGYVVGLCIEDSAAAEYLSGDPFSSLAGIPDPIIVEAVGDMRPGVDHCFQAVE